MMRLYMTQSVVDLDVETLIYALQELVQCIYQVVGAMGLQYVLLEITSDHD